VKQKIVKQSREEEKMIRRNITNIANKLLYLNLPTPNFLVHESIIQNNCERMKQRSIEYNLHLRPHVKTHKTIQGVLLQTHSQDRRIVVSTVSEAIFYSNEINDILYAVPITTEEKLNRILELNSKKNSIVHIEIDSREGFELLKQYCDKVEFKFSVFVSLDCGQHREGLDPNSIKSYELVKEICEYKYCSFAGLYTHGGHSYSSMDLNNTMSIGEIEASTAHTFAMNLKLKYGIETPVVSIGSTPTCSLLLNWDYLKHKYHLVNEIHPGNYIFYDNMMMQMGNCKQEDIAVSVLTSVIGRSSERNTIMVDAGALALSKDLGVKDVRTGEYTYGSVKNEPNMIVTTLTQEMGIIKCLDTDTFNRHALGSQLEILPNHSCLSAALFPYYTVIDSDYQVKDKWIPDRGW
jgi:D-serine deaminase-like pyridoxal phosphate-dependent protein